MVADRDRVFQAYGTLWKRFKINANQWNRREFCSFVNFSLVSPQDWLGGRTRVRAEWKLKSKCETNRNARNVEKRERFVSCGDSESIDCWNKGVSGSGWWRTEDNGRSVWLKSHRNRHHHNAQPTQQPSDIISAEKCDSHNRWLAQTPPNVDVNVDPVKIRFTQPRQSVRQ